MTSEWSTIRPLRDYSRDWAWSVGVINPGGALWLADTRSNGEAVTACLRAEGYSAGRIF